MTRLTLIALLGACGLAGTATAQTTIFHDPFLNWDFRNFTGQTVNDFEIIVESPTFVPPQVYTGGLGFPNFVSVNGDFVPGRPGNETKLSWSGRGFAPDAVAHVGAAMMGSGRILDAYWTSNGQKVGPSLGISYELTRVTRNPTGPSRIDMVLQTSPAFALENPGSTVGLRNIRTYMDMPASLLGLDDITSALDERALAQYATNPDPRELILPVDSFFDVFVGLTVNSSPDFESLLVADVVQIDPTGASRVIGQFWNINPQCPEPTWMAGLILATGGIMARRRSA